MLSLRGIDKKFGGSRALEQIDFDVASGEIVGLLGENGAGKSTLLGIAGGALKPTSGIVLWRGQDAHFSSERDARRIGIGVVHQHFRLVPAFTVAENLALHGARDTVFSRRDWGNRARDWAASLGWQIAPERRIDELGVGERQRVEILKALFAVSDFDSQRPATALESARVLLLDEPTANLTPGESDDLFDVLRGLKARGCGIVLVSHKLGEILSLCDRVVVLRRGKRVGERRAEQTDAHELAALMVGTDATQSTLSAGAAQSTLVARDARQSTLSADDASIEDSSAASRLEIDNLSHGVLRDFSLRAKSGEIVGLAGVDGNGQRELLDILCGLARAGSGAWRVDGEAVTPGQPSSRVALIPADRHGTGLVLDFDIAENMALHPAWRASFRTPRGLDWKRLRERTAQVTARFDVRSPHSSRGLQSTLASQLSGGNQQKLVVARALSNPHSVVVAADPTRGLDLAAAALVRKQLRFSAANGAAVLLVSSDLDEVLELSDRLGVFYCGRLLPENDLLPRGTSREIIGALMGGEWRQK